MQHLDLQSSFVGGEAAPDLHGRVDLAKYKTFIKSGVNFIGSPHGPGYNRPGTFLINYAKLNDTKSRVVPFISSDSDAYVLEFGLNYIWVYRDGVRLTSAEVTTTYSDADIFDLKFTQSVDKLYIAHKSYAPAVLTRTDAVTWSLDAYVFADGPFMIPNIDSTHQMEVSFDGLNYNLATVGGYDYFLSGQEDALFKLTYDVESYSAIDAFAAPGTSTQMFCGGAWRLTTSGVWTGTIVVQKSVDGGTTWTDIQTFRSVNDLNVNTFGTEDVGTSDDPYNDSFLLRLDCTALTAGTCHSTISRDPFTHIGIVKISSITDARHAVVTVIRTPITPQNQNTDWLTSVIIISDWAEGSWSTLRGWPAVVAFSQDRLCWGATPTEPQTVWMTRTSDYVNFGRDIPLTDSSGITINLLSRRLNPILSFLSYLNTLIALTNDSEWSILSDSGFLTPTTVYAKLQGIRGASSVDPIIIGDHILFVEARGHAMRNMIFEYFTQNFKTQNISTLSSHLLLDHSIVQMAYQQCPDSILWMVRDDGVLLSLTYLEEQEVICWNQHNTVGEFESVCVIPALDNSVDEVWFTVYRNGFRFVERMLLRTTSTDPADQYFVDCGFTYDGSPVSSFVGHTEFNGLAVAINAEGFVLTQQTVSGGVVNLDKARSKVQVGLPYNCDLELLHPEIPMPDGTSQGRRYQISRVSIRFLNTVGGKIGPNQNTLNEPMSHRDNALDDDTPTPLFSGFDQYTMPQDDDQVGHLFYRQSDPMPVTILSVTSVVEQENDFMLSGIDP